MGWYERDPLRILKSEAGNGAQGKRNKAVTDEAETVCEITTLYRHEAIRRPYLSVLKQVNYSLQSVSCSKSF